MILNPIDVIKTRYQVYDGRGSAYTSVLGAVRTIAREEGLRGFCSGMIPASIAATVSWGGYFYFYEGCKTRRLDSLRAREGASAVLSHTQVLLAGIEAGAIMTMFTNPLWLIKTRLQLQGAAAPVVAPMVAGQAVAQRQYTGLADAISSIVRAEGVRGLYRGLLPALFLTSHGAIQFVAYEFLKKKVEQLGWAKRTAGAAVVVEAERSAASSNSTSRIPPGPAGGQLDIPVYLTATLGFLSKLVATTATYPYQVVKSRLQQREMLVSVAGPSTAEGVAGGAASAAASLLRAHKYRGTLDCLMQIARHEGAIGFYKGYVANCIKVAPSAAITFAVYEQALKAISTRYE